MRKVILTSLTLLFFTPFYAQTNGQKNSAADRKPSFGFNIGINHSLLQSDGLDEGAKINNEFGTRLGLFGEFPITNSLSYSPKVELSFHRSSVELPIPLAYPPYETTGTFRVSPVFLEVISHLILKGNKNQNHFYFLVGPNLKIPIQTRNQEFLAFTSRPDVALDFGIGFNQNIKDFKVAPELRYSMGFLDLNEEQYNGSIQLHTISFVLNFKG